MEFDVGDPVQVKERKTKAQLARDNELNELKELLARKQFRVWLWKLLEKTKIFNTISYLDAHEMAIHSGQRDVGLWVLADILAADPEALVKMTKENS